MLHCVRIVCVLCAMADVEGKFTYKQMGRMHLELLSLAKNISKKMHDNPGISDELTADLARIEKLTEKDMLFICPPPLRLSPPLIILRFI